MRLLAALLVALPSAVPAETVLAARTLRAQTIVTAQDVVVKDVDVEGAFSDVNEIIGMETRVALYAGRPIRPGDVGPPAIVERNQIVSLVFEQGGITIFSEGRALARGSAGDSIRVMNLASRITVSGRVRPDGRISVSN